MAAAEARCVASPTRTVPGSAVPCRRLAVLTRSPATMPWPCGADGDGRLAGQHGRARVERLVRAAQAADISDEVERSPNRALGIILERMRRTPDGHHCVADELLDRPAVSLDPFARELEVARPAGRASPRRRAPSLSVVNPTRSANRTLTTRRSATGVVVGPSAAAAAPSVGVPHAGQNLAPGGRGAEQARQPASRRAPHSGQNFWPAWTSVWQFGQFTRLSASSSGRPRQRTSTGGSGSGRRAVPDRTRVLRPAGRLTRRR